MKTFTVTRRGSTMSIRKKLYWGFGSILAIVFVLFIVNIFAVMHERSAKNQADKVIELVQAKSKLDQVRMQNQLHLRNFLLSGDSGEAKSLLDAEAEMSTLIDTAKAKTDALGDSAGRARELLDQVSKIEQSWLSDFATPLMDRRRRVDNGSSTVAELQIAYLQAEPNAWLDKELGPLNDLDNNVIKSQTDSSRASDQRAAMATMLVTIFGFLVVIGLGAIVAW